ncbi:MAG: cysteine desulfurase-like protein [Woeseiaceae bacterium]|nr:cysteine desulfurase-like protein [Woeseiaceae bacterium]
MSLDLEKIRSHFPALLETHHDERRIYFDNPAGTQVPDSVAKRMMMCLHHQNANLGGAFSTSKAADAVVLDARIALADFLNAPDPSEIVFGQNMTTLTFHVSRSLGRAFSPGDEIIVSRMDHDANIWPWVMLAEDLGLEIRWLPFNTETYEFDLEDLDELLSERTRLVCVGGASNLMGTINDVEAICARAREAGALTYIDAVQSAPHIPTDVQALGCDMLVCSAYKFFGPHQGILWGRRELMESLEPYKVRPAWAEMPWCFETGTQSHEGMAGTAAAIDYFAWIGETMAASYYDAWPAFEGRRLHVHAALDCLFEYETALAVRLIEGLQDLPDVTVHGITEKDALSRRVPTVAFTHKRKSSEHIAQTLAERNIFVWSGHNYAVEIVKALGLHESGGVVRIGPVHYNGTEEIDRLLAVLDEILY